MLEIVHRRLRTPRRDEVKVRVEACSVSAVDVQARQGMSTYPPRFPFVPGYAVVGVVDAVGDGVTAVTPGDRVVAMTEMGGYAEHVHVHRHPLLRVPAGMDAGEVVVVALNYLVAHQALSRSARIRRRQAVLITGAAGGIDTALVQLGRLLELRMYGVDSAEKHPWLAAHGVVPLGTRGEDVVGALRRLEPAGVDAVLDGAAGPGWTGPTRCWSAGTWSAASSCSLPPLEQAPGHTAPDCCSQSYSSAPTVSPTSGGELL